ncbi:MAG: NAD(P)-dependent glycerol-3-phosphate dehydrogenase [Candidatus Omnitrophica bacterium]|nr:NAD(P)-dependent glycerol-3-phosphate dehydrogenase [Candidatus Omnitrophota bacterium]
MHISILGDGGWGTTLAILLNEKGFQVTLWGAFEDYTRYLDRYRINKRFLPGVKIAKRIKITNDLNQAVFAGGDLIILSIPSQYMRGVLRQVRRVGVPASAIFLSVSKGIEVGSLKRMSEVMRDELKRVRSAVLSGPTIAREVAYGIPSVAVAASEDKKVSRRIQDIFMTERFRVYTNNDVAGVELGGSLKNIIAIACGISDGLGFGTNTKAALLSRGLVEISRLGLAMGARARTFSGISGLGDLVTTCISPYSRNRFVGVEIGKGKSLRQIQSHMQMVAEGVPTAKSAHFLSLKHKVEMPIAQEIYSVLYKNKSPLKALNDLMARSKKEE